MSVNMWPLLLQKKEVSLQMYMCKHNVTVVSNNKVCFCLRINNALNVIKTHFQACLEDEAFPQVCHKVLPI